MPVPQGGTRVDTLALWAEQSNLLLVRRRKLADDIFNTLTLRRSTLFAILGSGTGKDIIMTTTRPPGGSVFLVEDEVMIRMMVADMLEELGYSIAAEAGEINEAIRLAQSAEFDLAILDVNVNGKVISPVAELINARNRPFIFATGYGSSGLPEEYRDRPALQKPFQLETLARLIDSTLKGATGPPNPRAFTISK